MRPEIGFRTWAGVALAATLACGRGDADVVARVGDDFITVDEAAEYMKNSGYGANQAEVEKAVDELIDLKLVSLRGRDRYQLTAAESLQVAEWRDQLLYNQFREDVIWKDVAVDAARLREWYDENVGEEVNARHILIRAAADAPDSARQAARAKAESLLQLARDEADFAKLAEENSEDPSAQRGGSLGWFQRGRMVAPFEQVAFNTPAGQVAPEVVETQFGYHVIKVEDKRRRSFEDLREEIEEQLAQPERSQAERAYVTRVMEESGIEFVESAIDTLIALIDSAPAAEPTPEQRARPLATYRDGRITLGEIWDLYAALPESNQRMIANLDETGMVQALSQLAQRRMLLESARTRDTKLDSTRQRQLDERIEQFYAQLYLNRALEDRLAVSDSIVRQYYEEHAEFYRDQSFEQAAPQLRQILETQRMEELRSGDAQRELMAAIADSQAGAVRIERHPERYDDVMAALREKLEDLGRSPRPRSTTG